MTVYADILFLVNLYMDALLLSAVRRFLHLPLSRWRWLLSAALGGVFGLCALLPRLQGLPLFLLSAGQAFILICAAFAPKRWPVLLRGTFLLFLFGASLSGLLSLAGRFLPLSGMVLLNGTVYFDISPLLLVILTCLCYGVLWLFDRLFRHRAPAVLFSTVTVSFRGNKAELPAKVDTGLSLTEPFSGEPVLIAERSALAQLLPPDFGTADCPVPFRPVPYSSIGGTGILPAFRPDALSIGGCPISGWVAVSDRPLSAGGYRMLLGPDAARGPLSECPENIKNGVDAI